MKVLVLGANGRTGKLVVDHALAQGHEVSVLVRNAGGFHRPNVRVIEGDALNADQVLLAVNGQHAVLGCIGGTAPWKYQTLEREAMRNIVGAMRRSNAQRLVVVSAMGVGESRKQSPWWYRCMVISTFLRGIIADKSAMEALVRTSGLDWVIVRAPILNDRVKRGKIRVLKYSETGLAITRDDLAMWLVEQLKSDIYVGRAVVVNN